MKPKRKAAPIRRTKWRVLDNHLSDSVIGLWTLPRKKPGGKLRYRLEYQEIRSDRGQKK